MSERDGVQLLIIGGDDRSRSRRWRGCAVGRCATPASMRPRSLRRVGDARADRYVYYNAADVVVDALVATSRSGSSRPRRWPPASRSSLRAWAASPRRWRTGARGYLIPWRSPGPVRGEARPAPRRRPAASLPRWAPNGGARRCERLRLVARSPPRARWTSTRTSLLRRRRRRRRRPAQAPLAQG